jgi:hypothetical protein
MLRRPSSATFGGLGESLSDSGTAVFGKDRLPGQVRQRRTGATRADHVAITTPVMAPPGLASGGNAGAIKAE